VIIDWVTVSAYGGGEATGPVDRRKMITAHKIMLIEAGCAWLSVPPVPTPAIPAL
jgi:hypothetical protein